MIRHLDKLRARKYMRAANHLKHGVTFFPWTDKYTLLQGWLATRNHKSKVSTREVGLQSYTYIEIYPEEK